MLDILLLNVLSPMVLAFVLGILGTLIRGDLKIPDQVYDILATYLLLAIGLKGGFDLARSPLDNFGSAALAAALIGAGIPLWSSFLLRQVGKVKMVDAIALALHFGAVSSVTLSASISFLQEAGQTFEGFMPTMYVILELPAVFMSLALARRFVGSGTQTGLGAVMMSAVRGKSFLLLGGGVVIGYLSGENGYQLVKPMVVDLFPGVLMFFLLEMGTVVGRRLKDLREMGWFTIVFALVMPLVHGLLGVTLGTAAGLSVGGAMILGTIAASASYITAPAIAATNLPEANPGVYLTASLVLVFPLNLTLGLPIYFQVAQWLAGAW